MRARTWVLFIYYFESAPSSRNRHTAETPRTRRSIPLPYNMFSPRQRVQYGVHALDGARSESVKFQICRRDDAFRYVIARIMLAVQFDANHQHPLKSSSSEPTTSTLFLCFRSLTIIPVAFVLRVHDRRARSEFKRRRIAVSGTETDFKSPTESDEITGPMTIVRFSETPSRIKIDAALAERYKISKSINICRPFIPHLTCVQLSHHKWLIFFLQILNSSFVRSV